jgi:hypothetical protein
VSTNGGRGHFKPDLTVLKGNQLFAFIEYESTNSCDGRLFDESWPKCNVRNIKQYYSFNTGQGPKFWIIITTLPKKKIDQKNWKSWEFNKKESGYQEMISSPYNIGI